MFFVLLCTICTICIINNNNNHNDNLPFNKIRSDEMLAGAVTAEVEDGNIKAAIRILSS